MKKILRGNLPLLFLCFLVIQLNYRGYSQAAGVSILVNGKTQLTSTLPTGGTMSVYNGYTIHSFTGSGTLTVPANFVTFAELLVVGGGGGGGYRHAGGGGAGGLIHTLNYALNTTQQVYVGSGGAGTVGDGSQFTPAYPLHGDNGIQSSFAGFAAVGGGGGGNNNSIGENGGSGGGGSNGRLGGSGTPGQGNKGGDQNSGAGCCHAWGAGGGGFSAAAFNTAQDGGSNGGAGVSLDISGSMVNYADGGGGGNWTTNIIYTGGNGSGGSGGNLTDQLGKNGIANTGSGGGGGGANDFITSGNGGNGGSGIVIVKYPQPVIVWSSNNTNVATVDATGLVTGISAGTASITVSITTNANTSTYATTITVSPLPVAPAITAGSSTAICTGGAGSVVLTAAPVTATDLNYAAFSIGTYGTDQWQSFAPTTSGGITAISIYTNGCPSVSSTFTLYSGIGTSGAVLNTQTVTISGCNTSFVVNLPNIALTAGSNYTFRFQSNADLNLLANNTALGSYYSTPYGLNPGFKLCFTTTMTAPLGAVQWFKNGNSIGGATASTYTATTIGAYTCESLNSGSYSLPSNSISVSNSVPPTITAGGSITFCAPGSVILTASVPAATDVSFPIGNIGTAGNNQWQSFVPTIDGLTTSLQVFLNGNQNVAETFNIYKGTGTLGTLVFSQAISINASTGWYSINIPGGVHLTTGTDYTFQLIGAHLGLSGNTGSYGSYFSSDYGLNYYRLVFNTTVTPYFTPQWYNAGSLIAGASSASYTATASGTYTCANGTNGCYSAASNGIAVTANTVNAIALTSALATVSQTLQVNTPITNIAYATTNATAASFSGLPAGVTGSLVANVVTISGTPTAMGIFSYTVTLAGGCSAITATGTMNVINCSVALTSAAATNAQSVCNNTAITNITYTTNGATGAAFAGLPAGITGSWAANVATISGSSPTAGTFNYSVTLTGGGCGILSVSGTIIVNPIPDVIQPAGQIVCNNGATTAVNFAGSVTGTIFNWTNNVASIGLAASGVGNIASFTATNASNAPVVATVTVMAGTVGGGIVATATPTITLNGNAMYTGMDVAYNPILDLYYQVGGGGPYVNILTFDNTGTQVFNTSPSNHDWRGIWWNPNGNTLEGNACSGCSANGIRIQDLNASGYALGTGTTVLPPNQPNFQSQGDLDYTNNEIIYYSNGLVYRVNRTTGVSQPNIAITGLPVALSNLNQYLIGFSGVLGSEYMVYDYVLKRVYFISRASGKYMGTSQLPASTPQTSSSWMVGFANGQIWVSNSTNWKGYRVSNTGLGASCTGTSKTFTYTINPTPTVNAVSDQAICSGSAITSILLSGNVSGTVYNWTRDNAAVTGIAASGTGNISGSLTNTTNAPVTVTFAVTPSYTNAGTTCTGTPINVTVTVNPAPTVNQPANQVVCNNGTTATVNLTGSVSGTNYTWTNNNTSIGLAASGTGNIASFTATNVTAATATATITVTPVYTNAGTTCTGTASTFTITVNAAPAILCPASILVNNATGQCGATVTYPSAMATGIPTAVVTYSHASGSFFPVGATVVTVTATNSCGTASCHFTITVTDNEAPSITCAPSQTQTADAGICSALVTVVPPVTGDNCGVLSVTNNYTNTSNASGIYPKGTTVVTWTVTDVHGQSSTCLQNITVTDNEAPVLNIPAAITVGCGASLLPANTGMATATDNCTSAGSIVLTYTDNKGVLACGGTIARTWSATDASNNQSIAIQTITVTPAALPTMAAPADLTVACGGLPATSTISYSNGLSGGCLISGTSGFSTFSATPASCGGPVTETWTVTDLCGRTIASVSRIITVSPAALPTMTAPASVTVACGGLPAASTISFSNGLSGGCLISGTSNASTITAVPASCGGPVTETWTATDLCGRAIASVSRIITVSPAALPTMTAPASVTVAFGDLPAASTIGFSNGLSGGCSISGTSDMSTFTLAPAACGGPVTETWTATDLCGRTITSVSRIITVSPAALPTMTAPATVTISLACGASPVPSTIPFSNGLSGSYLISGTSNPSTFTTTPGTCGGTVTEFWTAQDACGRPIASVSRTITVSQNLGVIQDFVLFSGVGAVSNTGSSIITGDVGANIGVVGGFDATSTVNGSLYSALPITSKANTDLLNLYIHLSNIPITNTTHAPTYGSGETIPAGVYLMPSAGSLAGTLTIDGNGNPNAVCIIRFNGAFSAGVGSSIVLTNGLQSSNVFWISEGATVIGTSSVMKGTILAHNGAVTMGSGGDLEGRLLSTVGAVSFGPGTAYLPIGPNSMPIICVNTCSSDILGTTADFTIFSSAGAVANTGASGIIGNVGSDAGAISGFVTPSTLIGSTNSANSATAQAKIDLQNAYATLTNFTSTNSAHAPTFGSGETLVPGVYTVASAGSVVGNLFLDGQGDPNAVFIIRFGGALSTAAQSKVSMINGTRHCNVFWVAEGAVSMGAFSFMKGSVIAHNAAISMGANGNLEGRMLSTAGAISALTSVTYIGYSGCGDPVTAPIAASSTVAAFAASAALTVPAEDRLSIYPNPSKGILHLDYGGDISKVRSIDISDMLGKRVFSANHFQSLISLGNITSGVYFVRIHLDSKTVTYRIVVNK